jgi:hypothetical protein
MKKIILMIAWMLGTIATTNAQTLIEGNRIWDNWSVGLRGGVMSHIHHSAPLEHLTPLFGMEVNKQMTPVFALSIQCTADVNSTVSATAIDATDLGVQGKFNMMNLFGGYDGVPRLFEIEPVIGFSWLHYYVSIPHIHQNTWATRLGIDLNFNVGKSKIWTLVVRPALVFDMEGDFVDVPKPQTRKSSNHFDINRCFFELTGGIVYHFKTSSGDHYLSKAIYSQQQINALNNSVNDLRRQLSHEQNMVNSLTRENVFLKQQVEGVKKQIKKQ